MFADDKRLTEWYNAIRVAKEYSDLLSEIFYALINECGYNVMDRYIYKDYYILRTQRGMFAVSNGCRILFSGGTYDIAKSFIDRELDNNCGGRREI
jgi:hypothetical protein